MMITIPGPATRSSRVPPLPPGIADTLAANRGNPGTLHPLLLSLHEQGWSLASLAAPFGVSRESIRLWIRDATAADPERVDVPAPPPTSNQAAAEARRKDRADRDSRRQESADRALHDLLPRLRALQSDARALRGPSSSSPTFAEASAEYTALLHEALVRGVPASRLAAELGIRPVTIYARLRRAGYRDKAPSERRPSWAAATAPNGATGRGTRVAV